MTYEELQKINETLKTTDIKNRPYVEVNQRIKAFRQLYPEGFISNELISNNNGVCVFKSTVGYYKDGEAVILAVGHAYEKESSTFINKTSYIENCVPLDTQILTKDGWKFYYQIKEGEEVWSYNIETGKNEFCKLVRVNVYKDKPITRMETSRFRVECTDEHKWLVKVQSTEPQPIKKVMTKDLKVSHKIITAVRQYVKPSEIGKKLGWLMCDCDSQYTPSGMISTSYISQSKYIGEVTELFGEGKLRKKYNDDWLDSYEWIVSAETAREILGYFGMKDYKDLPNAMAKASLEDVAGCFESMMLADGSEGKFSSTYYELIEAIQIICARLGISTTFVTSRFLKKSTKPLYTVGIKKTDGAYFSEMKIKKLPPQDVWCPTTENGTWCMKQGSFVTITSNCETSACGRALGMLGIGIDTSVCSAEELTNAIANQNKEAPKVTEGQIKILNGLDAERINKALKYYKVAKVEDLTVETASKIIKKIQGE